MLFLDAGALGAKALTGNTPLGASALPDVGGVRPAGRHCAWLTRARLQWHRRLSVRTRPCKSPLCGSATWVHVKSTAGVWAPGKLAVPLVEVGPHIPSVAST